MQLQLEQITGQLRFLEDQTSLATITLAVAERDPAALVLEEPLIAEDDGWGILDAWRVAGDGFLAVIGGAFVVLATAGPILAVVGVAFLGWRLIRRRRSQGTTPETAGSGAA